MSKKTVVIESEELARKFHEVYKRLALDFGYETRKETRDFDRTSANGMLMIAVCGELACDLEVEHFHSLLAEIKRLRELLRKCREYVDNVVLADELDEELYKELGDE